MIHEGRFKEFGNRLDPAVTEVVRDGLKMTAGNDEALHRGQQEALCRTLQVHTGRSHARRAGRGASGIVDDG
jgi:hypothetical protein